MSALPPIADIAPAVVVCPLSAKRRHMQRSKHPLSIQSPRLRGPIARGISNLRAFNPCYARERLRSARSLLAFIASLARFARASLPREVANLRSAAGVGLRAPRVAAAGSSRRVSNLAKRL